MRTPALPAATHKPGFNQAINGFRGVCVLMVFAYHVANSGLLDSFIHAVPFSDELNYFLSSLRYGVELFFMISGYVIVQSLRRHATIGGFLRDRVLRIFPVWIPVHLFLFTAGMATGFKIFHDLTGWERGLVFIANLFLLPPLLPVTMSHPGSWSLTYEWLFYLLAASAMIAYHLSTRTARMSDVTGWFRRCGVWGVWGAVTLLLLSLFPRGVFFIPGVLVALNESRLKHWFMQLRFPALSLLVFLLAWRAIDLDRAEPGAYAISVLLVDTHWLYFTIAMAAALHLFSSICANNQHTVRLRSAALQHLGTISYSFYLWHPLVMFVVKRSISHLVPSAAAWAVALMFAVVSFLIAMVVSTLSYRWFEKQLASRLRAHWLVDTQPSLSMSLPIAESGATAMRKAQER